MDRGRFKNIPQTIKRYYLWKLARQVVKECLSWSTEQIMPMLIALISAWAALYFKLVPFDQTRATYIAYLLPFAAAFAAYLIYQILRAPFVLHSEQEREIERLRELNTERKPEANLLGMYLAESAQREQTQAMREHTAALTEQIATVRSAQTQERLRESIAGSMRASRAARLEEIREQLASHMLEAQTLLSRFFTNEDLTALETDVIAWLTRLEQFLRSTLGEAYIARVRSSAGLPMHGVYPGEGPIRPRELQLHGILVTRLARLEEFTKELPTRDV